MKQDEAFQRGWAVDTSGGRAHLFLRHGENALALCGLKVALRWLARADGIDARCKTCESIRIKQGVTPV